MQLLPSALWDRDGNPGVYLFLAGGEQIQWFWLSPGFRAARGGRQMCRGWLLMQSLQNQEKKKTNKRKPPSLGDEEAVITGFYRERLSEISSSLQFLTSGEFAPNTHLLHGPLQVKNVVSSWIKLDISNTLTGTALTEALFAWESPGSFLPALAVRLNIYLLHQLLKPFLPKKKLLGVLCIFTSSPVVFCYFINLCFSHSKFLPSLLILSPVGRGGGE